MRQLIGNTSKAAVVAALLLVSALAGVESAEGTPVGAAGPAVLEGCVPGQQVSISGAWKVESYVLRDGARPPVDGLIFFTESDWTVLFFIFDEDGEARRGSGEGGTYTIDGDRLTFFHRYNMSGGEAVEGFAASDWSVTVRDADAAQSEPCTIDLSEERLTIHFPSGNRMTFTRSSR